MNPPLPIATFIGAELVFLSFLIGIGTQVYDAVGEVLCEGEDHPP